jgi:glycosyltransferase involved in cell wall biosynthesis
MTPLLYSLHSGNLYGTERMALATIEALRDEFEPVIIAPAGPVHQEAQRLGIPTVLFTSPARYLRDLRPYFARHKKLVAIGTRVLHTVTTAVLARVYGNDHANLQVVHGGADERLSYGRKRWLDYLDAKQVAVSEYVKERLIANGASSHSIFVIENFLTQDRLETAVKRPPIQASGLRKVAVVSRLDPIKRIDLLMEALELDPSLGDIEFEIYGRGMDEEVLRARALGKHPNVRFLGFRTDVPARLAEADLLLHLCPTEPFGLAILEAMAGGLPVLVPDRGGAGDIVQDGRNGFHFRADDAWALAHKLHYIRQAPIEMMRGVAAEGFRSLRRRFSAECGAEQYRKLIQQCLS